MPASCNGLKMGSEDVEADLLVMKGVFCAVVEKTIDMQWGDF